MAYFDPAGGAPAMASARPAAARQLDPLARRAVQLSRGDTVASLRPGCPIGRLFGVAGANRLADPRLEAVRAYAVVLRHGGDEMARAYADALAAYGFGEEEITHARWLVVCERRAAPAPRAVSRPALGCAILLAVWLGMLAGDATADRVIGLVVGLLVAIGLVPLLTIDARPYHRAACA